METPKPGPVLTPSGCGVCGFFQGKEPPGPPCLQGRVEGARPGHSAAIAPFQHWSLGAPAGRQGQQGSPASVEGKGGRGREFSHFTFISHLIPTPRQSDKTKAQRGYLWPFVPEQGHKWWTEFGPVMSNVCRALPILSAFFGAFPACF